MPPISLAKAPPPVDFAVDNSLLEKSRQQPWFGWNTERQSFGPSTDAARALTDASPGGKRVIDALQGVWQLAGRAPEDGSPRLENLILSPDDEAYRANVYSAYVLDLQHDPGDDIPSVVASSTAPKQTPQQKGQSIRDHAERSAAGSKGVTFGGRNIVLGPLASDAILQLYSGTASEGSDVAYAARIIAHEVGHVRMREGAGYTNSAGEGLAELYSRRADIAEQTLAILGADSSPDLLERATMALGDFHGDGARAEHRYDMRSRQLTELAQLAGVSVRDLTDQLTVTPEVLKSLSAAMLANNGVDATKESVSRLNAAIFNWFASEGNQHPINVVKELAAAPAV